MEILFHREEGNKLYEVVALHEREFEEIVWKSGHGRVTFRPESRSFLLWEVSGRAGNDALSLLVGEQLNEKDIVRYRASGILRSPERRGHRSIFPFSFTHIPVAMVRAALERIFEARKDYLPAEIEDFYLLPPLVFARSRKYGSSRPGVGRKMQTQLWVFTKHGMSETDETDTKEEAPADDADIAALQRDPGA